MKHTNGNIILKQDARGIRDALNHMCAVFFWRNHVDKPAQLTLSMSDRCVKLEGHVAAHYTGAISEL